jgi:hypothetical protein
MIDSQCFLLTISCVYAILSVTDQTGSFSVLKEFLESPVAANALRR